MRTLEKQFGDKVVRIQIDSDDPEVIAYAQNQLDTYEEQRKLQAKYLNLENAKRFQEEELRDLQQHQLRLLNVTKKTTLERINEIDKLNEEAQKEAKTK